MRDTDDCNRRSHSSEPSIGRDILTGSIGGLCGTFVMTQFQNAWSRAQNQIQQKQKYQGNIGDARQQSRERQEEPKENATAKAAGKLAGLVGAKLSHEQKKKLGPLVHYSFGTVQGGIYGAALHMVGCRGGLLAGASFGAALFVAADEVAVPAAGLSGKPGETPLSSHLYGLASHLVYGVSTELTRKLLRERLARL